MTVWRQTRINITFLFKACLKTYCSPLPALLCFSHPLPWVLGCLFWFTSIANRLIHSIYGGGLLIIQVMRPRERRANPKAVQKPLLEENPKPTFLWHPPFSYASPHSDLLSFDLWCLGFKLPIATMEFFILLPPFLLQPQLKGGLWCPPDGEISVKLRKLWRGESHNSGNEELSVCTKGDE